MITIDKPFNGVRYRQVHTIATAARIFGPNEPTTSDVFLSIGTMIEASIFCVFFH